ncbi:beta-lactamase family protein [Streptomyces cynarae]|uniref:Beta-lactamase family protein n=1 Tax=Streptomyces cynarae TaxID=2981134 RepID=A0ABY6E550_9ACTN|nr:serine hydrolase domain-containing protein [Streptomyces cynarae]UXY21704.1 beta-lactamase family protein [Streptomyces cynarae]
MGHCPHLCRGPVTSAAALPQAQAATRPAATPAAAAHRPATDRAALADALEAVHTAGMYGAYAAVRDGDTTWRGAAGVADRDTGRPVTPDMEQRIGSISKAMTAVALLQQVAAGRLDLGAPVSRYLPGLVPGERGDRITVRMLLNHTSGIGDYVLYAFPSLQTLSTSSLDENRFRHIDPRELVRMGVQAPPTGAPGEKWSYSNTNYIIAGLLLGKLTGENPERYITRNVIRRAGLRHTYFPVGPRITGPHPKLYESFYGLIDPPRDYSVYDMSWAGTAGAVVSTMPDLDRFYRQLLTGRLLPAAELAEMETTVPMTDDQGDVTGQYGLGIRRFDWGCGTFWGHSGAVFGAETWVISSPDGRRQMALAYNLSKYDKLGPDGTVTPSPIDDAINTFVAKALCASTTGSPGLRSAGVDLAPAHASDWRSLPAARR